MRDIIIISLFGIAGLLFSFSSYAHDHHHVEYVGQPTVDSNGIALAIAKAQHNFDWSTEKWQGSVGVGSFDNKDAISFGAGKRVGQALLNGSIGRENGKYGYGFGATWRF